MRGIGREEKVKRNENNMIVFMIIIIGMKDPRRLRDVNVMVMTQNKMGEPWQSDKEMYE